MRTITFILTVLLTSTLLYALYMPQGNTNDRAIKELQQRVTRLEAFHKD